jgi:hypothetical protein
VWSIAYEEEIIGRWSRISDNEERYPRLVVLWATICSTMDGNCFQLKGHLEGNIGVGRINDDGDDLDEHLCH